MIAELEIKPCIGLASLLFGATMKEAEKEFGKAEEIEQMDDIEECEAIVWHYWNDGFSLFFDHEGSQTFNCVEIDNLHTQLWGVEVFKLKEKQIIELFRKKGITSYETELHDWGEKRLSFDTANIDFYFEKNKLISINYGKPSSDQPLLILLN
ncbi:MAG: hypothetical protein M3R27_11065 [Bacteroidota bacterium]|nr:hypothetical protein [Bacteroidota bacterium]